jgi:hypothetical protein
VNWKYEVVIRRQDRRGCRQDPFAIHQHGELPHPQRDRQDQHSNKVAAIVNVFRQGLL